MGMNSARFLADQKAVLVGVADLQGSAYDAEGLDVNKLIRLNEAGKNGVDYSGGERYDLDAIIGYRF